LFSYPSAEGKEFYLRAVNALTPQAVATIEDEMDEKTSVYLNKTESHEQYPACARYMRGNTTSSIAESLNNANMKVRQSDLYPALVALVEESQKRFHANKKAAHMCKTLLPPKILKKIDGSKAFSRRYGYYSQVVVIVLIVTNIPSIFILFKYCTI
jgi:hypothetical protein